MSNLFHNEDPFASPGGRRSEPTVIKESDISAAPSSPMLAIIIPCWNYEEYVTLAIRSVLSQEEANRCELVVVDDGSKDGSWEAILQEGVKAYRISNSGARLACLFGLDRTKAPFILFLDADDELAPGSLSKILSLLDPNVSKLQFSLTRIDQSGEVISRAAPALANFRDNKDLKEMVLLTGVYTSPPTSGNIFRRDVCEYLRTADYDNFVDGVTLFIAPFMGDIVSVSDELGRYRIHGRNDSGLGSRLNPATLHREVNRFVDRMRHLRYILATSSHSQALAPTEHMFYYLERTFYLEIAEGRRVRFDNLTRLVHRLWQHPLNFKKKAVLTGFFLLVAALPNHSAQRVVGYRLTSTRRRPINFVQALFQRV